MMAALDRSLLLLSEWVAADPQTIASTLRRAGVRVSLQPDVAGDIASQAALVTLVTLLVRTGIDPALDVPDVEVQTPLLSVGTLNQRLREMAADAFPAVRLPALSEPSSVNVIVGSAGRETEAARRIWLTAAGRTVGYTGGVGPWQPMGSLGALAAACMAAGEVVRSAVSPLPPRSDTAAAWLAPIREAAHALQPIPAGAVDIGAVDLISAGAITDSMLFALLACGDVLGDVRIFDDGRYDITNLNRYPLLRRAGLGTDKASGLAQRGTRTLQMMAIPRRFGLADVPRLRRRVVVGADDIGVRHLVQTGHPQMLLIGATSHDEVRVTEHRPNAPCAGCSHPYLATDDGSPIPTIAPVSFWAGLQLAVRLLADAGATPTPVESRYATYWPLRPGTESTGPLRWHPRCPIDPLHRVA